MTELNSNEAVREAAREAVGSELDIYQKIKDITLKALCNRQLDMENIQQVAHAVIHGISEGVETQDDQARLSFKQAASALDDALAKAAEASKLAIEEAAGKMNDFSSDELNVAAENIKNRCRHRNRGPA